MVARRFRGILGPSIIVLVSALVQMNMLDVDSIISFPAILIAAGVLLLLGRKRLLGGGAPSSHQNRAAMPAAAAGEEVEFEMDDGFLRVNAALGSANMRVTTDDFRGGEVRAVMGSAKLDMRDLASPSPPASLDVNCVMGEIALRVPPDWSVRIDSSAVMGEAKDARPRSPAAQSAAPDLIITGAVVMGSLKIED